VKFLDFWIDYAETSAPTIRSGIRDMQGFCMDFMRSAIKAEKSLQRCMGVALPYTDETITFLEGAAPMFMKAQENLTMAAVNATCEIAKSLRANFTSKSDK
jgi:hypothetical protein